MSLKISVILKKYKFCEHRKFGSISWDIDILSIIAYIKFESKILHMCYSCYCNYCPHSKFFFYLINFQLNTDFPPQFCIFRVKSLSITSRSFSQENSFKKSKNLLAFLLKTIGSNNCFTLIENSFQVFETAKFESKIPLWIMDKMYPVVTP